MIELEINDAQVTAVLDKTAARLGDMTPLMQDIGQLLLASTRQRFNQGISPDGVPWAAKSLATIEAYRSRAGTRNSRIDSRPLHGPSGALASTIAERSGADFAEIFSNMEYAAVMQFGASKGQFGQTSRGSSIPWGNIPARPFLGLSDADRINSIETAEDYLGVDPGN